MTALDPHVRIASLERELQWAQLKIQVLEERLRQQRIKMLGPRSETLSDLQLELLIEQEPGATGEEVEAESRRAPITVAPEREPQSHPGRQRLPENLPRVEQVIACGDATCAACGSETAVLGYDESEQLDIEPARYFVRVMKREKRVCPSCTGGTVTSGTPVLVQADICQFIGPGSRRVTHTPTTCLQRSRPRVARKVRCRRA